MIWREINRKIKMIKYGRGLTYDGRSKRYIESVCFGGTVTEEDIMICKRQCLEEMEIKKKKKNTLYLVWTCLGKTLIHCNKSLSRASCGRALL